MLTTSNAEPTATPIETPPSSVVSFPIERPRLKVRRNLRRKKASTPTTSDTALPYFIVGPENRLASFLAGPQFSTEALPIPTLIVGPSGVGKSTLALHFAARQAILNSVDGEPATVQYLAAVDFARQYAEAVASDDMPPLRQQIDEVPILVIDDLHLINDKVAAQNELAARLDSRLTQRKLTLLTCTRFPSDVRGLCSRLTSRTQSGMTLSMSAPQTEARTVILKELALIHEVALTFDLIEVLEAGLPSGLSYRALNSCIQQIGLWCRMNDCPSSIDAIQAGLDSVSDKTELSIGSITKAVARHFRLKSAELKSSSRQQKIVRARSLAMLLARQLTSCSLHQIGEHFGGRDHSTVLHAVRKTKSLIDQDADLRHAATEVTEKLAI